MLKVVKVLLGRIVNYSFIIGTRYSDSREENWSIVCMYVCYSCYWLML